MCVKEGVATWRLLGPGLGFRWGLEQLTPRGGGGWGGGTHPGFGYPLQNRVAVALG